MRMAFTFYSMSPKEAERWGVPKTERHLYARLDLGKANLCLPEGCPGWFKRRTVLLGRQKEPIGVLEPAQLAERSAEQDVLGILAKTIAAGAGNLERHKWYSLNELLIAMNASERKAVAGSGDKNRTRAVKAALRGPGCVEVAGKTKNYEVLTDVGVLSIVIRNGKAGYQFSLGDPPAPARTA